VLNNIESGDAQSCARCDCSKTRESGEHSFVANDLDGFQSSLADIFVDAGVTNTSVIDAKHA